MIFSSLFFLYFFLPISILAYFVAPSRFKNFVLLLASIVFYIWGAPRFAPIFLFSCLFDFLIARLLSFTSSAAYRRIILFTSIALSFSSLFYFKYVNFAVEQLNVVLPYFGRSLISDPKILLPIGISFFTFHKISYIVDVYRGVSKPCKSFIDYLLYITFFPQLIAGPIIRFHDVDSQLSSRESSFRQVFEGMFRFSIGLSKKVLIADSLGIVADRVFKMSDVQLTTGWAWVGLLSYAYQIYFDFSGYSDMAIGLAKVFGFTFLENFNFPYASQSITEFWRRWHISLSRWMRDYLYYPLGGNRVSVIRTYFNLWIVFLFSGFWHGASWNFIIWGMFHGFFIVVDKLFYLKISERLPRLLNVFITFFIVIVAWVFFRATTLSESLFFLGRMFSSTTAEQLGKAVPRAIIMPNYSVFVFYLANVFFLVPAIFSPEKCIKFFETIVPLRRMDLFKFILIVLALSICSITLATDSYKAFIYFRF